jgi:cephalosporin hydroxylase
LDSNYTHEHVLKELRLYSYLVTKGSYFIFFDTVIEDIPLSMSMDRPQGKGNNPKTAVDEFLSSNNKFEIDYDI